MTLERTEFIDELSRRIDDIDEQMDELWRQMDKLEAERKETLEAWQKAKGSAVA